VAGVTVGNVTTFTPFSADGLSFSGVTLTSNAPGTEPISFIQDVSMAVTGTQGATKLYLAFSSAGFNAPVTPPPVSQNSGITTLGTAITSGTFSEEAWADELNRIVNSTGLAGTTKFPLLLDNASGPVSSTVPATGAKAAQETLNPFNTTPFSLDQLITLSGVKAVGGNQITLSANETLTTPEPATLAMFGLGIAGMCGYGWKRRKAVVA